MNIFYIIILFTLPLLFIFLLVFNTNKILSRKYLNGKIDKLDTNFFKLIEIDYEEDEPLFLMEFKKDNVTGYFLLEFMPSSRNHKKSIRMICFTFMKGILNDDDVKSIVNINKYAILFNYYFYFFPSKRRLHSILESYVGDIIKNEKLITDKKTLLVIEKERRSLGGGFG